MREMFVIFAQRKERYEGEFAPELLDAIDDFANEGNPEWLEDRLDEHRHNHEYENVQVVRMSFDGERVLDALRPGRLSIPVAVRPSAEGST